LIISYAGNIPKEGYTFSLNDYKFTVKEVLKKRIKKVELEKLTSFGKSLQTKNDNSSSTN
jgi:CBS domain containing-hemolysin-like protein